MNTESTPAPSAHDPLQAIHEANQGIRRLVLDNGLVVLLKHDGSAPLAAVQFWVRSGAIHEGKDLGGGLSHFLEHMVFKGTPTRDPARISQDIADAGGDINAYTSSDRTVFHASLPSRNWLVALDVLADADNVCPYLDIPIQHINADLLKRMHRRGTRDDILRCVRGARARGLTLRTSLIVGFPGETEEDFAAGLKFVEQMEGINRQFSDF